MHPWNISLKYQLLNEYKKERGESEVWEWERARRQEAEVLGDVPGHKQTCSTKKMVQKETMVHLAKLTLGRVSLEPG